MKILTLTFLATFVCGALAQYGDSPVPSRINIPGAIALGPKPGSFRQGRVIQGPPQGAVRVRKPAQVSRAGTFKSAPAPLPYVPQLIDDQHKPVTEDADDIPESTPQPFFSSLAPYTTVQQQLGGEEVSQFLSSPTPRPISIPNAIPVSPQPPQRLPEPVRLPQPPQRLPEPVRLPQPPPPVRAPVQNAAPSAPIRIDAPIPRPQPVRIAPLSYRPRPQFRPETRPQLDDDEDEDEQPPVRTQFRPQPVRQQPQPQQQQQQQARPTSSNTRERKPVAQVIRKYREDNPDGSITWGFENDDGSFKEETIGIDCVTRGRYGYVDPDGLKREYNYETGILCDKTKENQEEQEQGFIDYQGNKAVLPNGVVVDLANMGKKSKRPQFVRN